MQTATFRDYLHLHFIVLLFGFTGILGKLISIDAASLVCWRMLLASIFIWLYARIRQYPLSVSSKAFWQIVGVGVLVTLHWVTFYAAIKVSNVSVTLGCFASTTLFTGIFEPLIEKRKIKPLEIAIGLIIIFGLYLITRFAFNYSLGITIALVSAALASLFGVLNKQLVFRYSPLVISFYEMLSGAILLSIGLVLFKGYFPLPASSLDVVYLLILSIFCTAYAFIATVGLMRKFSAYVIALSINLEPLYAIVMAYFIFGESEKMDKGFYVGALIILASVLVFPYLSSPRFKQLLLAKSPKSGTKMGHK
ncbi:MAG: DMT family transporter [Bacteroidetes bacterium]|nr:DMT family transporter [Bacteroidota bacterium]MCB9042718.1 DMT family transporter [Chitinophagales bacterium]